MLLKKNVMVESLLFIGAGAGAGEKNTRSRSKTDRLRNTDCGSGSIQLKTGKKGWHSSELSWCVIILKNCTDDFKRINCS